MVQTGTTYPPGYLWLAEKVRVRDCQVMYQCNGSVSAQDQLKFGLREAVILEAKGTQRQMLFLNFVVLRVLAGEVRFVHLVVLTNA